MASFLSGVIPGSGLLLSGNYGSAVVSFALNLIFLSGICSSVANEQYGIAGLLSFFEISWYFGGKRASAEAARKYNHQLVEAKQRAWLKRNFERHDLDEMN